MVYVLAAYSITLGTLALYGVFMQHRARIHVLDLATLSSSSVESTSSTKTSASGRATGFNLGAALLSPIWMWQHGMRAAGFGLLALCLAMVPLSIREMWIPFVFVAMIPLAAGLALGLVGNRIAMNHRSAESPSEFAASQLPWAVAGVGLFTVVLPWLWFFF